jgi:CDGSH-type Zn-finger protein
LTALAGQLIREDTRVALCRCGGSQNKPFCDGTHRTNGFTA